MKKKKQAEGTTAAWLSLNPHTQIHTQIIYISLKLNLNLGFCMFVTKKTEYMSVSVCVCVLLNALVNEEPVSERNRDGTLGVVEVPEDHFLAGIQHSYKPAQGVWLSEQKHCVCVMVRSHGTRRENSSFCHKKVLVL